MDKLIKLLINGLLMTITLSANANDKQMITKSANDLREYYYEKLDNDLKLLVVSDPKAQRAAAAVDVYVGSSAEQDEFLGLAHFLEHMLFLGTDQYPDPDDYLNYISEHGGNHNAFTAFDNTNYFFDIDPNYLHEGLKRFSRFFVAPLLSKVYVERERNAVDSEYHSKLREDSWRSMEVLKKVVNIKHPYSRFSIGNNETLPQETVRPALMEFYKKYYSSDRMAAIITGKEDINTLLKWGRELFSKVPKRQPTNLIIDEKLFDGLDLPIEIKNQSVKNEKNLSLYFQFPYSINNEYSKSLGYLSYILGYEGEGSLLEALKKKGYANSLYTGSGYRIGDETSFEIGIQLTDKGYQNTNHIVAIIFNYIEFLKNDKNAEQRYKEIATVAKTDFQFKEKRSAIHEVSSLAMRLNRYPVKDILALNAIFTGLDAEQVGSYLNQMNPSNAVIQITAPDIKDGKKTKYFGVPYRIKSVDAGLVTAIADDDKDVVHSMHLPKPNPFIADNYNLSNDEDNISEKSLVLNNGIQLFFKHNTTFNVPKSSIEIALQPTLELDIFDKTAMTLMAALIGEQLTTTILYDAVIAGVSTEIATAEKSLIISLAGYQQKMPQLLNLILNKIRYFDIDSDTFARVKDDYRKKLQNMAKQMPFLQTFPYLKITLFDDAALPNQRLVALDQIDEKRLKKVANKILKSLAIRMMVYGNNTLDEATSIANSIAKLFDKTMLKNAWQPNKAKLIKQNTEKSFFNDHADCAITYYIQAKKGYPARAEISLLAKMIEPQFFTQLRTEKQLGYVVFAYPRPAYDQAGIAFTIQSPVASSAELESHIGDFNQQFAKKLETLTEKEFDEIKEILKNELLQKPENLISAADLYWSDILPTGKAESSRKAIAEVIDYVLLKDFIRDMQFILTQGKKVIIKANPKNSSE